MRRLSGVLLVAGAMLLSTAALAGVDYESYKDKWTSVTYSGNDGTLRWGTPWYEIGESDGPTTGAVHVGVDDYYCADHKCLHIWGLGEPMGTVGVYRYADLSVFATAELCYDITRLFDEQFIETADAGLYVQITPNGTDWKTVDSFGLQKSDVEPLHRSVRLDGYLAEGFAVRFVVAGVLGGEVFVDNVEIKGTPVSASTTSTSTTTTIKPTTTTTVKPTTTTTRPKATTTTTRPKSTTTTTRPQATTTTTTQPTTTTTLRETTTTTTLVSTTTTEAAIAVPPLDPPSSGLRLSEVGPMNDYSAEMFSTEMEASASEVLSFEVSADYSAAVEVIESAWVWTLGLALIITGLLLAGLDRRRMRGIAPQA